MELQQTYERIIKEIERGGRGLIRFSEAELETIVTLLNENLIEKNHEQLKRNICLLEHSAGLYAPSEDVVLKILNTPLSDSILVFTLNCARRHIIQAHMQKGHRLKYDFLETLKKLLHSPSPEVVEWTLRTIEECGNQGVYFLQEFDKIKPAPWKWFNVHQRAVREIITMLERRWSRFEKPKS